MEKVNFSTMKTRTALRLGNMQTSDPFYTYLGDWVNDAGNRVITRALSRLQRRRSNLFPELYDYWIDLSIIGQDYLSVPDDVLWIENLYHFQKTTAVDMADDPRYRMTEISSRDKWEFQTRSSTPTGYPNKWIRYGNRLYIHPTPSSGYTTYVLIAGFAREDTLSGDSATFIMDALWNPAVIDMAVYIGATEMGWVETAQEALTSCDRRMEEVVTILGRENATNLNPIGRVANDPTN